MSEQFNENSDPWRPSSGKPKCPKCGEESTFIDATGTYWDSNAHYWRLSERENLKQQKERIMAKQNPNSIFTEIGMERVRQRQQWGGGTHDDNHDIFDWFEFMRHQMHKVQYDLEHYQREGLIKIAALAIAALESLDRKAKALVSDSQHIS